MRTSDIEIAVASHFNWRQNIIVPNVSWGLFGDGREIDLAIVRPSGWLVEVEIKITASDIKADLRKRHWRLNMQQKDKTDALAQVHKAIVVCRAARCRQPRTDTGILRHIAGPEFSHPPRRI